MSGTVKDKATAFKNSVVGSNINKIVCKASSHDMAAPKKKHVDFLITLTNNPNASMTQLQDMLGERLHNSEWIVAFKALITSHNLMALGNERFLQTVATRSDPYDLDAFADRTTIISSEMSGHLRKYGRYLNAICKLYRQQVLDFYRMPRGDRSPFRTMETAKLLKTTGSIQATLDLLLENELNMSELTNGIINTAFVMLYQDLTKIYASYNDALINLLEHFFEMKKLQCKEVIEIYRKFLVRQDQVYKFFKLAEECKVDQGLHRNLRLVPSDLLTALEQHLGEMDTIRSSATAQQPSPQIQAASEKLTELKNKSSSSGRSTPTASRASPLNLPSASDDVLSAQKKRFEELKKRASEKNISPSTSPTIPETTPTKPKEDEDEFHKIAVSRNTPQATPKGSSTGFGDLVGLENAWSSGTSATSTASGSNPWAAQPLSTSTNPFQTQTSSASNPWGTSSGYQEISLFPSQSSNGTTNFDNAFGGQSKPTPSANGLGDILQPISMDPMAPSPKTTTKKLTGDIDSSLVHAADNLSIELTTQQTNTGLTGVKKSAPHQWSTSAQQQQQQQQQKSLTGGPNYQKSFQLQPTTLPPSGMTSGAYGGGFFPPQMPQQQPFGMQPMGGFPQQQQQWPGQQSQNPFASYNFPNQQPSFF